MCSLHILWVGWSLRSPNWPQRWFPSSLHQCLPVALSLPIPQDRVGKILRTSKVLMTLPTEITFSQDRPQNAWSIWASGRLNSVAQRRAEWTIKKDASQCHFSLLADGLVLWASLDLLIHWRSWSGFPQRTRMLFRSKESFLHGGDNSLGANGLVSTKQEEEVVGFQNHRLRMLWGAELISHPREKEKHTNTYEGPGTWQAMLPHPPTQMRMAIRCHLVPKNKRTEWRGAASALDSTINILSSSRHVPGLIWTW